MKQDISDKGIAPYMGWATWLRLLEGLKTFIPPYFDRSYFDSLGFSGTQRSQAVRTLLFLDLITESKRPTDRLQRLTAARKEDYQRMFREVLENAYKPFFDNPGPENATVGTLEEYIKSTGASRGVVSKCVTFFLSAAKEADVSLSPQLSGELGRNKRKAGKAPRQLSSKPSTRGSSEKVIDSRLAQSLVEKFPDFDPNWSDDRCKWWFEAFQELTKRLSS